MPAPENKVIAPERPEEPIPELPPRETTQTDHINKKLLISLFNRMNDAENSTASKTLQNGDDNESDEWED